MEQLLEISNEKMRAENIDIVCETNHHELSHEQKTKKKEFIEYLKKTKTPRTEWVFQLDELAAFDWDNILRSAKPFGPLNVGTDAVLSAATAKIPLCVKYEHLNMYRELKMSFRAMRQAEKDTIKFIKKLDTCAQTEDFLYIIHLLNADDKKEQVKNSY